MKPKILYIEDNPLNMRLVRKILTSAGYDMVEAIDGISGLEMAVYEQPDLILVDVNLPDIDGLAVTRQLKTIAETKTIPVIALITANSMHRDRERCMDAGCDGYVPKPVTRNELIAGIGVLIAYPNAAIAGG